MGEGAAEIFLPGALSVKCNLPVLMRQANSCDFAELQAATGEKFAGEKKGSMCFCGFDGKKALAFKNGTVIYL
jgi:hypothetical protein